MTRSASGELRLVDWFCGAGGSTQGAAQVPGVRPVLAANHDKLAIESHATNFPDTEHFRGDIRDVDVARHPYGELYWASPECKNWTVAKGQRADYADHPGLWDAEGPGDDVQRSRALMEDVVRYLRGMAQRSEPVLAGVVENVTDIRKWIHWGRWRGEIEALGYKTRLIALNSAHAAPHRTPRAPQSRDRLYLAYWHISLGRDPDWDKWLRPRCWCSTCEEVVDGIQTWKREGQDMGRYGAQYYYRCPKVSCRGARVEPFYLPAQEAIDWSIPGQRIGDRDKPLSPKTMARIESALRKWGPAIIAAQGNTYDSHDPKHPQHGHEGGYSRSWTITDPLRTLTGDTTQGLVQPFILDRRGDYRARSLDDPLSTITANETSKALVVDNNHTNPARPATSPLPTLTTATTKALLVPVEGRAGKSARPADELMRTQTTRSELALLTTLRGRNAAKPVDGLMDTVAASGNHHGLLVPYYGTRATGTTTDRPLGTVTTHDKFAPIMRNNTARGDQGQMSTPAREPLRTLTTSGHQSLLEPPTIDPMDCLFRMLEPHEIGAGMAFLPDYIVLGTKRQRVKQYGNAVTPPVAEVLMCALVECIQGYEIAWGSAA